ncbi:MAG: Hpt domain-containing protein [Candidatus Rokuibacteriota bacterium]
MIEDRSTPPLDLAKALTVVGGDKNLLVELAQVFQLELPARLQALRRAVATGDAEQAERVAHNLKGALASLGATRARDLAHELEQLGRASRLDTAPAALARFEQELARISDFVSAPDWVDAAGRP